MNQIKVKDLKELRYEVKKENEEKKELKKQIEEQEKILNEQSRAIAELTNLIAVSGMLTPK